jgi:hypothetical protein
MGMLKEP